MAERRMFAKSVVGSGRFLQMPPTSRLLCYDLGMAADDDGIVEAFTVIRTTGAAEDDLRVLAAKGFVTVLNGDLVSYISDWSQNNLIKKDRYHPSVYHELLVQLNAGTQMEPDWNPSGTQMEPEVRLGKDRLGKARRGEGDGEPQAAPVPAPRKRQHSHFVPPTLEEVTAYVRERGSMVDPQGFIDFYAAKGWMVGKNLMKDWKAACRNAEHWERWQQRGSTRNEVKTASDYESGDDFFTRREG